MTKSGSGYAEWGRRGVTAAFPAEHHPLPPRKSYVASPVNYFLRAICALRGEDFSRKDNKERKGFGNHTGSGQMPLIWLMA